MRLASLLIVSIAAALAAGCATTPTTAPVRPAVPRTEPGERIATLALAELGRRYRFGGDSRSGFDCSGLAVFVHASEGIAIPRTAAAQFAGGEAVPRTALRAGDLVFFRFHAGAIDHVGVYVGNGQFVHAPGAGSTVRIAQIDAPWFARRFAGAARWWRDRMLR